MFDAANDTTFGEVIRDVHGADHLVIDLNVYREAIAKPRKSTFNDAGLWKALAELPAANTLDGFDYYFVGSTLNRI